LPKEKKNRCPRRWTLRKGFKHREQPRTEKKRKGTVPFDKVERHGGKNGKGLEESNGFLAGD